MRLVCDSFHSGLIIRENEERAVEKTDISAWGRKLATPYRSKDKRQAKKKASRKSGKIRWRRRRRSTGEGGRALREFIDKVYGGGGVVAIDSELEDEEEEEEEEENSTEGSIMALKKGKQNGFTFQEEQEDQSHSSFGNSVKKGGQAEPPPPLSVPKQPRFKGGSVKSPMNQDRSPWK